MKKKICILGSTGSIGTQTLEVIAEHPDLFEAYVLTAGRNADLLIRQAKQFQPQSVVIADESKYTYVCEALKDEPIQVYAGADALCQVVQMEPVDVVLTALVGFSGLRPTISAIQAGKPIALANKETLVVAGELITGLCLEHKVPLLPVDSEHSAIFQSLMGEESPIEKIILTASGGPFRTFTLDQLRDVTPAQALKHPNWDMGAKITIDSASMMNKGFEVIEARWLFDVTPDRIQVVVHPQSILHSAVQFEDGAVKGQMGMPDMRVPIQLALSYPLRLKSSFPRIDWWDLRDLTFARSPTPRSSAASGWPTKPYVWAATLPASSTPPTRWSTWPSARDAAASSRWPTSSRRPCRKCRTRRSPRCRTISTATASREGWRRPSSETRHAASAISALCFRNKRLALPK